MNQSDQEAIDVALQAEHLRQDPVPGSAEEAEVFNLDADTGLMNEEFKRQIADDKHDPERGLQTVHPTLGQAWEDGVVEDPEFYPAGPDDSLEAAYYAELDDELDRERGLQ